MVSLWSVSWSGQSKLCLWCQWIYTFHYYRLFFFCSRNPLVLIGFTSWQGLPSEILIPFIYFVNYSTIPSNSSSWLLHVFCCSYNIMLFNLLSSNFGVFLFEMMKLVLLVYNDCFNLQSALSSPSSIDVKYQIFEHYLYSAECTISI